MKIYFCGSIRGGRADAQLYHRLINKLKEYGTVLTEHVGDTAWSQDMPSVKTDKEIYDTDMAWLESCDAVVAEVTCTSMGVGFELGRAVGWGKKILCLFRPPADDPTNKTLSAMVTGAHDGKNFVVQRYKEDDVDQIFKDFFSQFS